MTGDEMLTPYDVAKLFNVHPRTVTRWHKRGWLPATFTPGKHRRFKVSDVQALLEQGRS